MAYLIGADIGTSGVKSVIMDSNGKSWGDKLVEHDVLTPQALWAEQWPDVWVRGLKESVRALMRESGIPAAEVKGIGISGLYGGSGIPLDARMRPVRPCLIWMDRRAKAQEDWVLRNIGADKIFEITKNGTDPYYGYTKMLWIKDNEPENWAKIKLFLPPNSYAIYCLTGEVAIDFSSAGNIGGIFDLHARTWSKELMDQMGIPFEMMPSRIVESDEVVGCLTAEAAGDLLLDEGTPVCAGGVDCVVATLGMGVFEPGLYAAAIGTSMCAALIHGNGWGARGLIQMPYAKDARNLTYSFSGGATAGAIVKWYRDELAQMEKREELSGGPNAYAELDRHASDIPAGSDGLVVLPYFMGERTPIWDTNARGAVIGLSLNHTKYHIYRAFLEAVAYSLRHSAEAANVNPGARILGTHLR